MTICKRATGPRAVLAIAAAMLLMLAPPPAGAQNGTPAPNPAAAAAPQAQREGAAIMVHVRARDAYLAHHAALTNLAAFRETMTRQLNEHFANPGLLTAEQVRARVERELARLERAAPAMTTAEDAARAAAIEDFDRAFPIRLDLPRGGSSDPLVVFAQLRAGIANLRPATTNSALQRMTGELETLIIDTERKLRGLSEARLNELNGLPRMFFELAGRASFVEMTVQDANQAIARYRTTLQAAARDLGQTPEQRQSIATETRSKLDAIGAEIRSELAKLEREIDEVQSLMINAAKSTFSRTVSENSFNYLLILFGAIFLCLLLAPMIYKNFDNEVARSLLKSEFILQFSTVFVLTSAIIILGIGGLIKEDQLPVLLAGISGYVLGQLGRGRRGDGPEPQSRTAG